MFNHEVNKRYTFANFLRINYDPPKKMFSE